MLGSYKLIEGCCLDKIVMSLLVSFIYNSRQSTQRQLDIRNLRPFRRSIHSCHLPRSEFSPWSNMYDSIMEIAYRSTNGAFAVTASIED